MTVLKRRSLLLFGAGSLIASPGEGRLSQPWVKKGRILAPDALGSRFSRLVSTPSVVLLPNNRLRMFFWTRQGEGDVRYIYAADASVENPYEWKLARPEPLLGPSASGTMRSRGAGFPFVLPRKKGGWLLYYNTWGSWAPDGERPSRTGLAISHDQGLNWRVVNEAVLPLGKPGEFDAALTGSVCVLQTKTNRYDMWYTAGERYEPIGGAKELIVNIGYATSRDGITWTKPAANPALASRQHHTKPYETIVSKPFVLIKDGIYHMWYNARQMDGRQYQLRYARSNDGLHWKAFHDQDVIPLTPGAFDSENQSYPDVIEVGDELWMFYTGNQIGSTGIGLATMKTSQLV